jgi:hypothetical protein
LLKYVTPRTTNLTKSSNSIYECQFDLGSEISIGKIIGNLILQVNSLGSEVVWRKTWSFGIEWKIIVRLFGAWNRRSLRRLLGNGKGIKAKGFDSIWAKRESISEKGSGGFQTVARM